ncbi:MAG TPA: metalloregulator ArsR/SmtB family transcription factor [Acidobacteriota bacterium]|nr:metalloregulator ArsR/SmtB family transcription factor [Acidobacteriota bacterium]
MYFSIDLIKYELYNSFIMDRFIALSEPTRRNILEFLANKGEVSATEIYNFINAKSPLTPPAISQHLKILREAKLLDVEKRAQQRIYRVNPVGLDEFKQWIEKLTESYEERFQRLDRILEKEKKKSQRKIRTVKHAK